MDGVFITAGIGKKNKAYYAATVLVTCDDSSHEKIAKVGSNYLTKKLLNKPFNPPVNLKTSTLI